MSVKREDWYERGADQFTDLAMKLLEVAAHIERDCVVLLRSPDGTLRALASPHQQHRVSQFMCDLAATAFRQVQEH